MDIETRQIRVLTQDYDNFPLWSPRGDLIMFSRLAEGDYEVYTVEPDGSNVKRLTRARHAYAYPPSPVPRFSISSTSRTRRAGDVVTSGSICCTAAGAFTA